MADKNKRSGGFWGAKSGAFKLLLSLIVLLLIFAIRPAQAQQKYDKKIARNRSLLKNLEGEISKLKKNLSKSRKKEESLLQQINLLDKEAALISRSKGVLQQQRKLLSAKIKQTNLMLANAEERYQNLKALYARRAVYSYKYGKVQPIKLILSSASLNQALIRYRYLKLIAAHDKRMIDSIRKKKDEIRSIKESLTADLNSKKKTLSQIKRREYEYSDRKRQKEVLLKKINWNQSKYRKRLAGKEKQKANLIRLLVALEKERRQRQSQSTENKRERVQFNFKDFYKAKGKLPWPVRGKIVTRYGKQRDAKSKTYIKNTDIEIKSKLGTAVHCVFSGIVRVVTYLPGYGNTVIVEHGKGYYTVYAHLAEIYVHKGAVVETNKVIGTVGDSGSLAGAKLQFGIYGGNKTYNPEKWLRKN